MASHLERYMLQTCSLAAPASVDSGGVTTYATATTSVACRAWRQEERRQLPDGEVYTAQAVLQLKSTQTVATGYRVTSITNLSGTFRIREVNAVPNLAGTVDRFDCWLD